MKFALLMSMLLGQETLVAARGKISDLLTDFKYASSDNFLKTQVYPSGTPCLLRTEALDALVNAADALRRQGFRIKVFDCYRPRSVQYAMWKILPKPGYVANPRHGSNHNRGVAVDLTLTDADATEVEMPTPFDFFGREAHHSYAGGTLLSRQNRKLLCSTMEAAGFRRNPMEWWHYDLDQARDFPILDKTFGEAPSQ